MSAKDKLSIVSVENIPKTANLIAEDNVVELYKLFLQLENLCLTENGVGLSAVQAGLPWQVFVVRIDFFDKSIKTPTFRYFLNCEYLPTEASKKSISVEGCLSLRDNLGRLRSFRLERFDKVVVRGRELIFRPELKLIDVNEVFDQGQAIVLQHEIDHGMNILISDIGQELDIWANY